MKNTLLILLFLLISAISKGQTSDSTVNQILAINDAQFIGQPLNSIISVLPSGIIDYKVRGIRNTARKLVIHYPDKVWVELHVRSFNHMNEIDPNRVWDVNLMKMENLYQMSVYKNLECYKNCATK